MISLLAWAITAAGTAGTQEWTRFFEAIRTVETGGIAHPRDAVGDGGRSIGPYQISRSYWADSGLRGRWVQCRDRAFAEAVMLAYWHRHCPRALRARDFETLARVHNGGPQGHRKTATLPYWRMVRAQLAKPLRAACGHPPIFPRTGGYKYGVNQEAHAERRDGRANVSTRQGLAKA